MGVIAGSAVRSPLARPAGSAPRRRSRSPWRLALRPSLANTAMTVITTAQEPSAKWPQAATPHQWHCVIARRGGSAGEASSRGIAVAPTASKSPTRRLPVNRDASLFLAAAPDTGPSGRHASADRAGFAASVGPLRATSDGAPVWSNRRRSRSARDRSSRTRRPGSHTARTRTDGQTPAVDRHRRRGVDQPRPRQDTRPACVLPGTVWGAASGQNCQVEPGAVLTLNSASRPLGRRGARCLGYPPRPRRHRIRSRSGPDQRSRRPDRSRATAPRRSPHHTRQKPTMITTVGLKSLGQFK